MNPSRESCLLKSSGSQVICLNPSNLSNVQASKVVWIIDPIQGLLRAYLLSIPCYCHLVIPSAKNIAFVISKTWDLKLFLGVNGGLTIKKYCRCRFSDWVRTSSSQCPIPANLKFCLSQPLQIAIESNLRARFGAIQGYPQPHRGEEKHVYLPLLFVVLDWFRCQREEWSYSL